MLKIAGYKNESLIYESINSNIFRALRSCNNSSVIIKTTNLSQISPPSQISRLQREFYYLKKLASKHIINAISLENTRSGVAIVFEDIEARDLASEWRIKDFTFAEKMEICIKITQGLAHIHEQKIIHKDISPKNIIINRQSGIIKIIDFGIASELGSENQEVALHGLLEGSLPYISPEQTGRMNRDLDYRSDFYSLGILIFELMTGRLPFEADDEIGFVHCHIAIPPPRVEDINPEVPIVVGDIIAKLLAKDAESRYQSANGLIADLEKTLNSWHQFRDVPTFSLAEQDFSPRFHVPKKLFGRTSEIEYLNKAFNTTFERSSQMVLVHGFAGVGKTSLINELRQNVLQKKGIFIAGKFDMFSRSVPYSALAQALDQFVSFLLKLPQNDLDKWREKISSALGPDSDVFLDVVPRMSMLIGQSKRQEELGAAELLARNRRALVEFFRQCADRERPIVIFLDDLQWADSASLEWISHLITARTENLLLICAYRDNEVDALHPFIQCVNSIRKVTTPLLLPVGPLKRNALLQMVQETMLQSIDSILDLGNIVFDRTSGNPFYVREFLYALYSEKLIWLDSSQPKWCANLQAIESKSASDNVVDLVLKRLKRLPAEAISVIKICAALGDEFDYRSLVSISEDAKEKIAAAIYTAINHNVIIPLDCNYRHLSIKNAAGFFERDFNATFRFIHDRVRQAADKLSDDHEKRNIHIKVARYLHSSMQNDDLILDVCNHYNIALDLLSEEETEAVSQLNLKAALKASKSCAYKAARGYIYIARKLLKESIFRTNFQLGYQVFFASSEIAFLCSEPKEAESFALELIEHCDDAGLKAKVLYMICAQYLSASRFADGANVAITALQVLGIRISRRFVKLQLFWEAFRIKCILTFKNARNLRQNKELSNEPIRFKIRLLLEGSLCAYQSGELELSILQLIKAVRLLVRYGNCPEASYAYMTYSSLPRFFNNFDEAKAIVDMAMELNQKYESKFWQSRTLLSYCCGAHLWHYPLTDIEGWFRKAIDMAKASGDTCTQSIAGVNMGAYAPSDKVTDNIGKIQSCLKIIKDSNNWSYYQDALIRIAFLKNVRGETLSDDSFDFDDFSEDEALKILYELNAKTILAVYFLLKAVTAFYNDDTYAAYQRILKAQELKQAVFSVMAENWLVLYRFLITARHFHKLNFWQKIHARITMFFDYRQMSIWERHNPDTFKFHKSIMRAEKERLKGAPFVSVLLFFDAASETALKISNESRCLAAFLTLKYVTDNGTDAMRRLYAEEAARAFSQFQGDRLVQRIQKEYSLKEEGNLHKQETIGTVSRHLITKGSTTSSKDNIDLTSVIKTFHAIHTEKDIKIVISKLLLILIENAHALRGYLLLQNSLSGELIVENGVDIDGEVKRIDKELEAFPSLPEMLIKYVVRSKETIIIDNAMHDERYSGESFVKISAAKSILITPILYRGDLIGIIYLDNNDTANVFTRDRLEVVEMLAAQAAISIKNAQLYRSLEDTVRKQTAEIQSIFKNIKQGILTFNPVTLKISEQYSIYLEEIFFGRKIVYQNVVEFLFDNSSVHVLKRQQLAQALINNRDDYGTIKGDLVREYDIETPAGKRYLELDWDPLYDEDGKPQATMVTVRDVTALRNFQLKEQRSAKSVQEALLTDETELLDATIYTYYKAADSIGGDWYGCYQDKLNKRIYVFIGDVTGHGIPSSLVTGAVAGAISISTNNLPEKDYDTYTFLENLLQKINQIVITTGSKAKRWMTMAAIGIDQITGEVIYLNAGHNPFFHISKTSVLDRLAMGSPLGSHPQAKLGLVRFSINEGDSFFIYTDGLTENYGLDKKRLTHGDIRRLLRLNRSPEAIHDVLKDKIRVHWENESMQDDCAFIAISFDSIGIKRKERNAV